MRCRIKSCCCGGRLLKRSNRWRNNCCRAGGSAAELRIIFQRLLLLIRRQVFVAAQPLPGMIARLACAARLAVLAAAEGNSEWPVWAAHGKIRKRQHEAGALPPFSP